MEAAITTLIKRLETVTARLESVEKQLQAGAVAAPATSSSDSSASGNPLFVQEYEDLINQFIVPYVEDSKKIGAPEVATQAELVLKAAHAQLNFLKAAAACKKPADADLQKLIKPTSDLIGEIAAFKDKNRNTKFPNFLATVSEGIAVLGWVVVSPTPVPHINDMRGGSEFYSNRILKDAKGKDQTQVDWVTHFNGFLKELGTYVKKHHTTGTTWNPKGQDASSYKVDSSAPAAPAPSDDSAPPPPGPPPPAPVFDAASSSTQASGPDMNAVFNALNKGEGVTSGLKKVTSDMKSKNRTDKVSSLVPASATKQPSTSAAAKKSAAPTKPPKLALEGNKWVVEYQVDNKSIVISETEPKQTVYIYKCKNCLIQIKGKVNAVILDDSSKSAVVFEQVVASFEVVNCNSVEIQVLGKVPSIAIDKTGGCQVFLSKESLETEIVTSKSSEMNVSFPVVGEQDPVEVAVPEQYKSKVINGKLITETVQHV